MIKTRDLTLTDIQDYDSLSVLPKGIIRGEKNFLNFIKNDLIPIVEKKYASVIENRGYFGY